MSICGPMPARSVLARSIPLHRAIPAVPIPILTLPVPRPDIPIPVSVGSLSAALSHRVFAYAIDELGVTQSSNTRRGKEEFFERATMYGLIQHRALFVTTSNSVRTAQATLYKPG